MVKTLLSMLYLFLSNYYGSRANSKDPAVNITMTTGIRLYHHLFDNYNKKVRPVFRDVDTLEVRLQIHLYQILETREREQYVKLYIWVTQQYINEFLGWNPSDFDEIYYMAVPTPHHDMWIPDIYLYNGIELEEKVSNMHTTSWLGVERVGDEKVHPITGEHAYPVALVIFWYPMIAKFNCEFNTLYFPFDTQTCQLNFGSWGYNEKGIRIISAEPEVDISAFVQSDQWDVLSFSQKANLQNFSCCPHPYSVFVATIVMKRRPLYYIVNLIVPTVIITEIAILGFFTPSSSSEDRGEKVSLGMATLLALAIMLIIVSELMPPSSHYIPIIGLFFIGTILLIAFGCATTCWILAVHRRGKRGFKVSKTYRKIFFQYLAPYLGMASLKAKARKGSEVKKIQENSAYITRRPHAFQCTATTEVLLEESPRIRIRNGDLRTSTPDTSLSASSPSELIQLHWKLKDIKEAVVDIRERVERKETKEEEEWRLIADIMDRFMLLLFTLILTLLSSLIFLCGAYLG